MTEPMSVSKYGFVLPASTARLAEADVDAAALRRWMNASPQERAELARQAGNRNAEERAAAETIPLTLDTLLARVDRWRWSREYVEHLVQPYCECEDSRDGWEFCQHALDLGLTP